MAIRLPRKANNETLPGPAAPTAANDAGGAGAASAAPNDDGNGGAAPAAPDDDGNGGAAPAASDTAVSIDAAVPPPSTASPAGASAGPAPGPGAAPGTGPAVGPDGRPADAEGEPLPGYGSDTRPGQWLPDLLGPGFSYTTLPLAEDEEGPVSATLVRYEEPQPEPASGHGPSGIARLAGSAQRLWTRLLDAVPALGAPGTRETPGPGEPSEPVPVVLVVHGWTDYFYNVELARYWSGRGYRFYALDLRRYGRSLRAWQTPGFVADLAEYDADIDAALAAIAVDVGGEPAVVCQAHSTGGLVMALWADRNPGRLRALVLNSPWLEMQGSAIVRYAAAGLLDPVARLRPKAKLKLPEADHYWQSLSRDGQGEWDLHPLWRPRYAFPVTAGWLTAVLAGHAAVAKGLDIRTPVLVLTSARTHIAAQFEPQMLEADSVIEVDVVRQRAVRLGREVTVVRIEKGMHDLFTSGAIARRAAYTALATWSDGYLARLRRDLPGR